MFPTLILLLLALAGPAAAQLPPGLRAGDRIQLESPMPGQGRVLAQVVEAHPGWLAFRPLGESLVWTRRAEAMDTILVSRGRLRARSAKWGGAWGGYVGSGAGTIVGILSAWSLRRGTGESAALGATAGAFAGLVVGVPLAVLLADEQWTTYVRRRE